MQACGNTLDPGRPPSWSKLILVNRAFANGADWAWWLDADAAITNLEIDVRQYCRQDVDFVVAKDEENGMNCGSFLMRNSDASRALIDAAWNRTEFIHHQWWEQKAIAATLMDEPDICTVLYVPQRAINSYPTNWQPGDLVIHAPGYPDRKRILLDCLERARTEPEVKAVCDTVEPSC